MASVGRVAGRGDVPLPPPLLRDGADRRARRSHRCTEASTSLKPPYHPRDLPALVAEEGPAPKHHRVRTSGCRRCARRPDREAVSTVIFAGSGPNNLDPAFRLVKCVGGGAEGI